MEFLYWQNTNHKSVRVWYAELPWQTAQGPQGPQDEESNWGCRSSGFGKKQPETLCVAMRRSVFFAFPHSFEFLYCLRFACVVTCYPVRFFIEKALYRLYRLSDFKEIDFLLLEAPQPLKLLKLDTWLVSWHLTGFIWFLMVSAWRLQATLQRSTLLNPLKISKELKRILKSSEGI